MALGQNCNNGETTVSTEFEAIAKYPNAPHGRGYKGFPLTGRYRVQRDIGDTWATFRESERYGGSWERVEWIGRTRTLAAALQAARMGVNRLVDWRMSQGRGSRYWTARQDNSEA